MTIDGPTLLVSSAHAAVVATTVMRTTRTMAKRGGWTEGLLRFRIGHALGLLGLWLIGLALERMTLQ
jgi:hypothetical protein